MGRRVVVAVMAKTPGMDPTKTRLQPPLSTAEAIDLYRCFLLDRLDALATLSSINPVVAVTPPEGQSIMASLAPPRFRIVTQRGRDLGERLSNVLSELLADGHPGALAIDSDSPTLPMTWVTAAAEKLGRGGADVVLGPCDDGGYYLIGVRAPQPELFRGMPWSTDRVLKLTLEKAAALHLNSYVLPPWFDVDTEPDLRRLHREMLTSARRPPRTFAFVSDLYRRSP